MKIKNLFGNDGGSVVVGKVEDDDRVHLLLYSSRSKGTTKLPLTDHEIVQLCQLLRESTGKTSSAVMTTQAAPLYESNFY
jgi:hypothetical protein